MESRLSELSGKKWVCHCRMGERCHADILIARFGEYVKHLTALSGKDEDSDAGENSDGGYATPTSPNDMALLAEFARARGMEGVSSDDDRQGPEADLEQMAVPPQGLFVHVRHGTWHVGGAGERMACGKPRRNYVRMGAWPDTREAWCKVCARKVPALAAAAAEAAGGEISSDT